MSKATNDFCVNCKYFYFNPGSPDYSEYTPGESMSLECYKGHWNTRGLGRFSVNSNEDLRKAMVMSKRCPDFEGIDI